MTDELNSLFAKGKPFYFYDLDGMLDRLDSMKSRLANNCNIFFAMKSNFNRQILSAFAKNGIGVDVVSGGEIKEATQSGFKPDKIVFSGVGKSMSEVELALQLNLKQLNVESEPEILRIQALAKKMAVKPRVALRVNPDVSPDTHPHIRTGFRENKFGLDIQTVTRILEDQSLRKDINFVGLTSHIGSQILDTNVFGEAIERVLRISDGFGFKTIDVGGGLGINYHDRSLSDDMNRFISYANIIKEKLSHYNEVLLEPGRFVVARFGTLYSPIEYIKRTPFKNFVILASGINHLIRPALYEAYHAITSIRPASDKNDVYDVVGPICESTDVLGRDRLLPSDLKEGDWVAIQDAGAYGFVMANNYNLHELPKEYVSIKGKII